MPICRECGHFQNDELSACVFNTDEDNAVWLNDYEAMNKGLLTHREHQLIVARWASHNKSNQSEKALNMFSKLVSENWGLTTKYIESNASALQVNFTPAPK